MRRYENRETTRTVTELVEHCCDGCGISAEEAWPPLMPVAIEVNHPEEFGSRDEYDFCDSCLAERADVLTAAGSRSPLVNAEEARRCPVCRLTPSHHAPGGKACAEQQRGVKTGDADAR